MINRAIKITDEEAEQYLKTVKMLAELGVPNIFNAPYIVMVKGYGDDWDEYSELTTDDLDNENVVDAGYEDYELWLNDTFANLIEREVL